MRYINILPDNTPLPRFNKAQFLIDHAKALVIPEPTEYQDDLVCVVTNSQFDAAAYADEYKEFMRIKNAIADGDRRPRIWLIVPYVALFADKSGQ